jgi:undecaprenyl diphosphate synthase
MTSPLPAATPAVANQAAPRHVAIIMDGNGRWARERGLPRLGGHKAGTEILRKVVRTFAEKGVKYLTIFAFSTENWSRPEEEVEGLWRILAGVVDRETATLREYGIRLRHLGRRDRISPRLLASIDQAVALTKDNDRLTLSVALDYGGRGEIIEAVRSLLAAGVRPGDLTEEVFSARLYTAGLPDPDLVIRTAGEMRMSNFLIWQSAYAEFYVTSTYWPDFDQDEIEKALAAYSLRQRRFGGVVPR